MNASIIRDRGMKSRKLWFTVFVICTLIGTAAMAAAWKSFAVTYETLAGSIVATAALYLTGNVAQKWIGAKASPAVAPAPPVVYADTVDEPLSPPVARFSED